MRPYLLLPVFALALTVPFAPPALAGDAAFWGTGIGAALGGFAGSNIGNGSGRLAATGAGVFLGGLVGNSIGSSMDRSRSYGGYYQGGYYAPSTYSTVYEPTYVAPYAPPPPTVVYVQPQVEYRPAAPAMVSGSYVGVSNDEPDDAGQDTRYCREYTQKVKIDGKLRETYGTACLQPDGTWKITR